MTGGLEPVSQLLEWAWRSQRYCQSPILHLRLSVVGIVLQSLLLPTVRQAGEVVESMPLYASFPRPLVNFDSCRRVINHGSSLMWSVRVIQHVAAATLAKAEPGAKSARPMTKSLGGMWKLNSLPFAALTWTVKSLLAVVLHPAHIRGWICSATWLWLHRFGFSSPI